MSQVLGPDILLAILNFCGEIQGRKRFQKIAYLLKKRQSIQVPYNFIPYLYGPYSKALQMDLGFLCSIGLVEERHHDWHYSYSLTKEGVGFLKSRKTKRKSVFGKIRSSCKQYQKLSTNQLVEMAYKVQEAPKAPS